MAEEWEAKIQLVRQHYTKKGYRVHSGLQFGCELVLYADDPSKVHSDFCIHVVRDGKIFWKFLFVLSFSPRYSVCASVLKEEESNRNA